MATTLCYSLSSFFCQDTRVYARALCTVLVSLTLLSAGRLNAQDKVGEIDDISGKYHFLTADDTLALLEEEGKLKGYIDVYQGEEESDALLSYPITLGWRKKERAEFKTGKIHQKYYRFEGTVQHGEGHDPKDPDYLRLVGDLQIVSVKPETGEEMVQRVHVVFKSMGRAEGERD